MFIVYPKKLWVPCVAHGYKNERVEKVGQNLFGLEVAASITRHFVSINFVSIFFTMSPTGPKRNAYGVL